MVLTGGWSGGTVRLLSSLTEISMKDTDTKSNPLSLSSPNIPSKEQQVKGRTRAGHRKWTAEEDMLLRKGIKEIGEKKWMEIARRYLPHKTSNDIFKRWTNSLRPDIKTGAWSAEEDAKLVELVKHYGESSWVKIARQLDGRKAAGCCGRWRDYLDPTVDRSEWKTEEDEIIKKVILEYVDQNHAGLDWQSLLHFLPTKRCGFALRNRYQYLKKQLFPVKKAQWTKENEAKLLEIVKQHGTRNWNLIASYLPPLNRVQCSVRYNRISRIRNGLVVVQTQWREEEDVELAKAVKKFGDSNKWTAIAASLSSSRTAMECKVRWERELSRLLNASPWTKQEDDLLIVLRNKALQYDDIFRHLKSRTYSAIAQRCNELGVAMKSSRRWTEDEVALLAKLVNESKEGGGLVNWKWIAKQMPSKRTAGACYCNLKKDSKAKTEEKQEAETSEKS
eukprot:scaffold610_cov169-Ochromonas_danica.AAC.13